MKLSPKIKNIFFQISAILILIAAVVFNFEPAIAKYIMVAGVAGFGATIFTTPYPGKSLRGKRLFNIQVLAVILMAVATYLMFIAMNGWVVLLLISALLTLYCSVMLPRIYKEEQEEDKS